MAFSVKYRKECIGKDGLTHRLDFSFDGYSGGVLSLGNATNNLYNLEVGALGASILEPIRTSRLNIQLVRDNANTEDLILDAESASYGEVLVHLYQGSTLAFVGLLETSLGDRGRRNTDTVQFIAKTGFDYLKAINFPSDGRMALSEIWANCFSSLPYQLGFFVDDAIKTQSSTKIGNVHADTDVWKSTTEEGETVYESCYEVLEETLLRFALSIVQFNGYFHLQAPYAYEDIINFTEYDETGVELSDDSDELVKAYDEVSFNQVRDWENERKKPQISTHSIVYKHGELGGFQNGGFELWDGGTWVENWTRSNSSYITRYAGDGVPINDKDLNFNKHVRLKPFFSPSTDAPNVLNIDNVYIENTQGIYLVSGSAFTFVWRGKWTMANQGVFASEARSMFYRLKCGTHYWDATAREWTATETINHALVNSEWTTIKTECAPTPTSDYIEARIYNGVDHIVSLRSGMTENNWDETKWEFQAGSGIAPNINYFLVDAVDAFFTDEEGKSPTEQRTSISSGIYNANVRQFETLIGDGVTSATKGRLTYLDGASQIDTTEWQGMGFSEMPLDELIGRVAINYLGKPQLAVSHNFLRNTAYILPTEALENGSRFFPNYWYYKGLSAEFGGEFVEIQDFSISSSKNVFKNLGSFRDTGGGLAIFRQQSQNLFNTGTANILTRLRTSIPSGSRNTIPIDAIGSLALKVGDKITLIDRDTGVLHTLTVRTKPSASATTLDINTYNFPDPIRIGSPIYRDQGDLNAVVVQTDTIYRQMYKATGICYVNGAQTLSGSGSLNTTAATAFIPSGTTIWIKNTTTTYVKFTLTQDVNEGDTVLYFNSCTSQPSGSTGGNVPNNADVKPEGFASMTEISQNATAIISKASQTQVDSINSTVTTHTTEISQNATAITLKANQTSLDTTNATVTTHATLISQNASEITLRAERNKLINDINTVTQTSLRINPDKIILDGEVETTRSIRSAGYSAGVSGWIINGNGNAEFNEVTVRGGLIDQDVVGKYVSLDEPNGLICQNAGNRTDVTTTQVYLTNGSNQSTLTPTSLQVKNMHAVLFVSDNGTYITVSIGGTNYDLEKH